jgi:hypothetical protein
MTVSAMVSPSHARQGAEQHNSVQVEIAFAWSEIGRLALGEGQWIQFPDVENVPGLYRFSLETKAGRSVYIGETMKLRRRFAHYRSPGSRQQTNSRINRVIVEALKAGGRVTVSVVVASVVPTWNLDDKFHRVMLEHAAIAKAKSDGLAILNEVVD